MTSMFGPNQYNQGVVTDTGWMTLTLSDTTNFALYSSQPIRLRQIHRMVYLTGALDLRTATFIDNTSDHIFCTIPDGFRPVAPMLPVFVCQGTSLNRWCLRVYQDGTCSAQRYGPGASVVGTWLPFNVTWALD